MTVGGRRTGSAVPNNEFIVGYAVRTMYYELFYLSIAKHLAECFLPVQFRYRP